MREFTDAEGVVWEAGPVSHGRTSGYLNPKVHRPVIQFTCRSKHLPRKYASLPPKKDSFESLTDEELVRLLANAETH